MMRLRPFIACSSLHGLPIEHALDVIVSLGCVPQLTPGCVHASPLEAPMGARTHHGFHAAGSHATRLWSSTGEQRWVGDSCHPPIAKHVQAGWRPSEGSSIAFETMYPGYGFMHDGRSIADAIDMSLSLAVDLSHIDIQLRAGIMAPDVLQRLLAYDRIAEIHVSRSVGKRDTHLSINGDEWWTGWIAERWDEHMSVVLECNMHSMSSDERMRQVELLHEIVGR